jgi:hypothetical protein
MSSSHREPDKQLSRGVKRRTSGEDAGAEEKKARNHVLQQQSKVWWSSVGGERSSVRDDRKTAEAIQKQNGPTTNRGRAERTTEQTAAGFIREREKLARQARKTRERNLNKRQGEEQKARKEAQRRIVRNNREPRGCHWY